MKVTITVIAAILILAPVAFAQQDNRGGGFENHKKKELEGISLQIQALNKKQGCVSSAQNSQDLQKCNRDFREAMKHQQIQRIEEQQKKIGRAHV